MPAGEFPELHPDTSSPVGECVSGVVGDPKTATGFGKLLPLEEQASKLCRRGHCFWIALEFLAESSFQNVSAFAASDKRAEIEHQVPCRLRLNGRVDLLGPVTHRRP